VIDARPPDLPDGSFMVTTRRGKQFNSMVFDAKDPLTGAGRDAVYAYEADAATLGIREGDRVRLTSEVGTYEGAARIVRLPSRSLEVHWPEGNVLLPSGPEHREPGSQTPDYNAVVTLEKA
jgi:anaerobic selenocysteine-containing dehydrogenase